MNSFNENDFSFWNSITKYPSILTYHLMDGKGNLTSSSHPIATCNQELFATEKIDGTNARIIISPNLDYLIGSREDLLFAKGDRIGNPSQGIVNALKPIIHKMTSPDNIPYTVIYGEVYGGNINGWKNYTNSSSIYGFRVFDVAQFSFEMIDKLKTFRAEQYSGWRESGGQKFLPTDELNSFCKKYNLEQVPTINLTQNPPITIQDTNFWLSEQITATFAHLISPNSVSKSEGKPEGIVIRTKSRELIAKIRFEDYRKANRKTA